MAKNQSLSTRERNQEIRKDWKELIDFDENVNNSQLVEDLLKQYFPQIEDSPNELRLIPKYFLPKSTDYLDENIGRSIDNPSIGRQEGEYKGTICELELFKSLKELENYDLMVGFHALNLFIDEKKAPGKIRGTLYDN